MSAAVTSLRALEMVAVHQPIGVSELARQLQIPKATAQRALHSLSEAGWIRRSEGAVGTWILTAKPLDLARHVGRDLGVREIALPGMAELVEASGESAHLAIPDGTDVVIIERVEATQIVRIHWPVGTRSPAYATANGKAILSALRPEVRAAHLPTTLRSLTTETITSHQDLNTELATIARRGYAVQHGELRADIASVAAPICVRPGHPVASMSVFMPIQRFPDDGGRYLGERVAEAADKIAADLVRG